MIFLGKVSDSHGEFPIPMVHVRPGSRRRITSLTSVWCAPTGSVAWLRKLGELKFSHSFPPDAWNLDLRQVAKVCRSLNMKLAARDG